MDSRRKVSAAGFIQLQRSQRLFQQFLTDAAAGLSFSQDAGVDLRSGGVSYNQADFHQLFRPSGALEPSAERKPQERKLHRPAPRPPERSRGLLPLMESEDQTPLQLQDSCSTTRLTAGRYLKRASGVSKPVRMAAHRNQDQIILDMSSKYQKDLQRWTGPDKTATHPDISRESLTTDPTDPVDQVQTAVSRPPQSDSAASDDDSWLAARRSALDGDHSQKVIQRLLGQLFFCQDDQPNAQDQPPDVQLVVSLLTHLSSQTTLVRSLLAEQLNSSETRHRLMSCGALCSLRGPVNKDVVHKLTHLICNDHSDTVRLAAAETLMKLGKRLHLHHELRSKLEEGRGLGGRKEALVVIGHLKLMTATLLEPLVSCLSDEFPAVRKQACLTAASLLLKDERVVIGLLQLVENDAAAEVRLSAITAVGALGLSSPHVQETLLRCVETEEEAELRLAACRLLQSCGVPSAQLQDFLLQRVQVESDWLVCRTMKEVLRECSLQEEHCHTQYISLQVKRLCEWSVITEKLLLLDELQVAAGGRRLRRGTLARLLGQRYIMDHHGTADQG